MARILYNGKYATLGGKYAVSSGGGAPPGPSYPTDSLFDVWRFDGDLSADYAGNDLSGAMTAYGSGGIPSSLSSRGEPTSANEAYVAWTATQQYSVATWVYYDAGSAGLIYSLSPYVGGEFPYGGTLLRFEGGYFTHTLPFPGSAFQVSQYFDLSGLLNSWVFVVGTFDSATIKLWVNNDLKATNYWFPSTANCPNFYVGGDNGNSINSDGTNISSTFLYNKILTTDEMDTLYNSGAGV